MRSRSGFTLLEICLAIAIGLLLLGLAVPSVVGLLTEERLKQTFERFDELVHRAQNLSLTEQRTYLLVLEDGGVSLRPESPQGRDGGLPQIRLELGKGEKLSFERPAAIGTKLPAEWPFWRSGNCEPVVVSYSGDAGHWVVSYDPLTARGKWIAQEAR